MLPSMTFSVYVSESRILGKPYGIELTCYCDCGGESHGNMIGNTLGTREKNCYDPKKLVGFGVLKLVFLVILSELIIN